MEGTVVDVIDGPNHVEGVAEDQMVKVRWDDGTEDWVHSTEVNLLQKASEDA